MKFNIWNRTGDEEMVRVAVLDDTEKERDLERALVEEYFEERKIEYTLRIFERSETLLLDLQEKGYYDIFLLDVEVPGDRTGLQVAREIRRIYMEPFIVFITNYVEYAVQAFEVNTFRYIPKIMLADLFPKAFDALLPLLELQDQRTYVIERWSEVEKILLRDIYYAEKDGKYIIIVHRNGKSRERKTLQALFEELHTEEFIYIDRCYIVNIRHVCSFQKEGLTMRDKVILPVSKPRLPTVRERIAVYWRENQ